MASPPRQSPRRWRYTWETLAHIPTLRLYLFSPGLNPLLRFRGIAAALRSEESVLLVRLAEDGCGGGDVVLRVPVPKVLVDSISPVDCHAREDHIEVKLVLLLPVDHPVVAELRGVLGSEGEENRDSDQCIPLSLDSDLKDLTTGGVDFFCKACSTKLTKQPIRHFVEMPSVNWQDVADNWFGACWCYFGGASEKLVSKYMYSFGCTEGACLLDAASVILCMDDLEGYTFQHFSDGYSGNSYKLDLVANSDLNDAVEEGSCGNFSEGIPKACDSSTCVSHMLGRMTLDFACEFSQCENQTNSSSCLPLSSASCCGNATQQNISFLMDNTTAGQHISSDVQCAVDVDFLKLDLNHHSGDHEKPNADSSADDCSRKVQYHCCSDKAKHAINYASGRSVDGAVAPTMANQPSESSIFHQRQTHLHISSLGSGFMTRTSNLSNHVEWVEFLCRHCSAPLGSYPSFANTSVPIDGGIRLFKCYLSTSISVGGPDDVFKKYTLQRLFVSLLLESAMDELSFRTVVKDLKTKIPVLQIVLLNSKIWCSTGYCIENHPVEMLSEAGLRPRVKVLFSDYSTTVKASSRMAEGWSAKNHTEEVYMMPSQIEELVKSLNSAVDVMPPSCSSLQGMPLSSLER